MEESQPSLASAPPWRADRGDGTYRNPVLYADYSDPDAIRVGEDYWLTASSFNHAPGLPILHSRDLVNWTIVNHALPALVPRGHFAVPRHGQGVWAPSIRHRAGRFWIYYPDPDFGIYAVSASDPREAWSEPVLVKAGKGLIDPCPFWDDDGRAYLIHAWARSRAGISNRLTLHRLSADGLRVEDEGRAVIDADLLPGWNTLEGPKLYRRGGYYYVFAPAGGVRNGYQGVFRSRDLYGPYECRVVLAQGGTAVNGPHQGAWVETPAGEHWFLHFQEIPAYGRVMHLQPMAWSADGWPTIGRARDDGIGEPVAVHRKPAGGNGGTAVPATSDEFAGPVLGRQWQWQANPDPGWASFSAAAGSLRLSCVPLAAAETHWAAPHLLLQKFPGPAFVATTRLGLSPRAEGDTAGLMVFGRDYCWLGLRQTAGGLRLVLARCQEAPEGGREWEEASLAVSSPQADLRVSVGAGARCRFAYRLDGTEFRPIGGEFGAASAPWVGAKIGLFASAARGPAGHADFSWFRIAR
ncbi:MAG TPA: glycoside hydrolase 43 family protein [Opitutaceae bacterium]|nr:glycoside hydrolase 43 family protein [Opitutaceae bacterium]